MCCGRKPGKRKSKPYIRRIVPRVKAATTVYSGRFLMCRPSGSGVPLERWNDLHDRVVEHGGDVRTIKCESPWMVSTASGAFVIDGRAVVSNFSSSDREGDEGWFARWFAENDWSFAYPDSPFQPDCVLHGDLLFYNSKYSAPMEGVLAACGKTGVAVDASGLRSMLCPLGDDGYMVRGDFPALDVVRSAGGKEVLVGDEHGCNAIVLGDKIVLPSSCVSTAKSLTENGYTAVPVDVSSLAVGCAELVVKL